MDGLALNGGETVLDLYGGVGVFSAATAERGASVTLVESYPAAAEDARHNLIDLGVTVIEGTAEQALTGLADDPACVIVDPPSDGLSLPVIDALGARNISRLVYVSSDPATLARDAKRLVKYGYRLERVQQIDLSPQTYYIDCVATLTK
jgi:23S rRNA (uracil1939-C5)-methyltransferase